MTAQTVQLFGGPQDGRQLAIATLQPPANITVLDHTKIRPAQLATGSTTTAPNLPITRYDRAYAGVYIHHQCQFHVLAARVELATGVPEDPALWDYIDGLQTEHPTIDLRTLAITSTRNDEYATTTYLIKVAAITPPQETP